MLERCKLKSHSYKRVYQTNSDKTTLGQEFAWYVRLFNSPPYSHLTLIGTDIDNYILIHITYTE
jgi:hypothetical protein